MAIHVLAGEDKTIPEKTAVAFTHTACDVDKPSSSQILNRVRWTWNELSYEIAVLKTRDLFYIEFADCLVDETLYSGPFSSMAEVNAHLDLLGHHPKVVRITPLTSADAHDG
ncbi:MAG: hypothetical protein JW818_22245 [Pirellulales bacterium]|nr:hypothetical protein [Pirellulales bacterium]